MDDKKVLKDKYGDEKVFVVPFAAVSGIQDGFTSIKDTHNLIWTKFDSVGKYIYRYEAEGNSVFQQLISYVIVQDNKTKKYFIAERLAGDSRWNHKLSIGFGGHMNPIDGTNQILLKGMARELDEELYYTPASKASFIGYVRNLRQKNSDHIGAVFILQVHECSIKETDKHKGLWMTLDELKDNYFRFEEWGQDIINYLYSSNK